MLFNFQQGQFGRTLRPTGPISGALSHRTGTQTVAVAGTLEPVLWTVDDYDRTDWHDVGSDTSRFTVPAGVSLVQFAHAVKTSAVDQADQLKGGAGVTGLGSKRAATFAGQVMYSAPLVVSPTEYFEGRAARDIAGEERSWGHIEMLDPLTPYAHVKKSANQSITFNTLTAITWDQEEADAAGTHDNVTNNQLITIPAAWNGKYIRFICNIAAATTNGDTRFFLQKASANMDGQFGKKSEASGTMRYNMASAPLLAVTGDAYRVVCQNQTTGLGWSIATSVYTWWSVQVLEDATQKVVCRKSASQAFTGGSPTMVQFDASNLHGSTVLHNPSSSNTKIIAPAGSTQAKLGFNLQLPISTGTPTARVVKNGSAFYGMPYDSCTTSDTDYLNSLGAWVDCVAGDEFELELTAGANISVASSNATWFSGEFR